MDDARVDGLERAVRLLSAALGLDRPFETVPPEVEEHLAAGEDVRAVKALRQGMPGKIGLVEAKRMVDALKAER